MVDNVDNMGAPGVQERRMNHAKAPLLPPAEVIDLVDSEDEIYALTRDYPQPDAAGPSRIQPLPAGREGGKAQHLRPISPPDTKQTLQDVYVSQVLEVMPEVDPVHVNMLVGQRMGDPQVNVVELVLNALFENPDYPRVQKMNKKRKRSDSGSSSQPQTKQKIDYGSKDRPHEGGPMYKTLVLNQLYQDFPLIPIPYIRNRLATEGNFYAPTYISLDAEQRSENRGYRQKTRVTGRSGDKDTWLLDDDAFKKEREWLSSRNQEIKDPQGVPEVQVQTQTQEELEEGDRIECGCCFADYPFHKMIQCPEGHLFCTDCMTTYASTLLGSHDLNIVCMDQSGCKLMFPESELRRFLSAKLLELYDRVKQRKEIEAAGLDNLEECPFCEYKVVIENEEEKLFRCENEECQAITCRACKEPDHLPKSCEEAIKDKKLDARHAVEEAMTRALMRNCPSCQKGFVKETGCNKMTCPHCRTVSCYVCRQTIQGYDHFNTAPAGAPRPTYWYNMCPLWDSLEQRHVEEVTQAAKKAIEDYKRQHPNIDENDIQVELPPPPPPAANPAGQAPQPYVPQVIVHHYARHQAHRRAEAPNIPGPAHVAPNPNPIPERGPPEGILHREPPRVRNPILIGGDRPNENPQQRLLQVPNVQARHHMLYNPFAIQQQYDFPPRALPQLGPRMIQRPPTPPHVGHFQRRVRRRR